MLPPRTFCSHPAFEALSLDLALADSIKDKAHRWLGQITSVKNANDKFRVYFLVGAPQLPELREGYENALKILAKVPVEYEIVPEDGADSFANRLGKIVEDLCMALAGGDGMAGTGRAAG